MNRSNARPIDWLCTWRWFGALGCAALMISASPGVGPRWCAWLAWIAFAPLGWAASNTTPVRAAWLGWLAGVCFHAGTSAWIPPLVSRFSGIHPAIAIAVGMVQWSLAALGWGAWAAFRSWLGERWWAPLGAAFGFVVIERWIPMLFPYSLALSQYRHLALVQLTELTGPWGISALMVLVGTSLPRIFPVRRQRWLHGVPMWIALVVVAGCWVWGEVRLGSVRGDRLAAQSLRVGMVQGDVVRSGWSRAKAPELLADYQELSTQLQQRHGPIDLLVWPEKSYPLARTDSQHDFPEGHPRRVRRGFVGPVVFGLTAVDPASREVSNAAAWLGRDGAMRVFYEKVKLVPYSEWVPTALHGWIGPGYRRGKSFEPAVVDLDGRSVRVGALICYEATFPGHVRDLMRRGPELLVNLSDDTWFGDTLEPEEHLSHAVFRAVEARRDVVRASGGGISALVASTGEIVASTSVSTGKVNDDRWLVAEARMVKTRGMFGEVGDLFCWASMAVVLAGVAARRWRGTVRVGRDRLQG